MTEATAMRSSEEIESLHKTARRLEWLTTLWNVAEAAVAIVSGSVAGSAALIAFGADSLIEVLSGAAVLWRLMKAGPRANEAEHAAADRRAHLAVGVTFFLLAVYILLDAGSSLLAREVPGRSPLGLALAIASLIAMPILAFSKQRVGRLMGSRALEADAIETWLCAYLSATLLLGLGLNAALGWWWADPVSALAMVPFMLWQGRAAIREANESEEEQPA